MNTNHHNSHGDDLDEARLTAYALGQLDEQERAAVEAHLAGLGPDDWRRGAKIEVFTAQVFSDSRRQSPGP